MGRQATLSILALYKFDQTIFDDFVVPDSYSKNDAVDHILLECAELEFRYPDPRIARDAIALWSRANQDAWRHWEKITAADYSPIENYDRTETASDSTHTSASTTSASDNLQRVAAFNETALQPSNSSRTDAAGDTTGDSSTEHRARVHGNIGVTTNQQMINAEIDLLPRLNFYKAVTESFRREFCLLIY